MKEVIIALQLFRFKGCSKCSA